MSTAKTKDTKLAALIAQGNEAAFRELYDIYYSQLSLYANRILNDIDLSVDIVQTIFVDLYAERSKLPQIGSLRSYLFQSVHNRCLNELKHLKIVRKHQQETISENTAPRSASSSSLSEDENESCLSLVDFTPEELMEYAELQCKIEDAISALPEQCQRIFRMSRINEMTNDEIAIELGLSKRTVETQISKALKELRKALRTTLLPLLIALSMLQQ